MRKSRLLLIHCDGTGEIDIAQSAADRVVRHIVAALRAASSGPPGDATARSAIP